MQICLLIEISFEQEFNLQSNSEIILYQIEAHFQNDFKILKKAPQIDFQKDLILSKESKLFWTNTSFSKNQTFEDYSILKEILFKRRRKEIRS